MKKNILVINVHDLDCGAGLSCASTMDILATAGYNIVHVTNYKFKMAEYLAKRGIPTINCQISCWFPSEINNHRMNLFQRIRSIQHSFRADLMSLMKIRSILKSMGFIPDLIYTNTILIPIGTLIASIYRAPHVFHIREYGFHDFKMYFVLGRCISSYWAKKYTVMSLCISKGVQENWNDFFGGKTEVIYNGLPNTQNMFHNRGSDGKKFNIVLVGRLSEEKGQEFVVQRLFELKSRTNCKLSVDFWGDGKDKDKLISMVNTLHLSDNVHFCGFSEKIDYSKYHLAIMASRSEGFGRTTVEYMFNSIPVIGFNGGATPELIEDKVSGRLYNNSEEFNECVMDALSSYSDFQNYAKNAYKYACENFTLENYRSKILDFFGNQLNVAEH